MYPRRLTPVLVQVALGALLASSSFAADGAKSQEETHTKAHPRSVKHTPKDPATASDAPAGDNTALNKRDRDDDAKTADQQKNDKSDVELAAQIRRAVVDDKALSTNAQNVKIIVEDGHVTLKGPVASAAERAAVEKKATDVAGRERGKVTNEINIAP